jgi:hypothetical protein
MKDFAERTYEFSEDEIRVFGPTFDDAMRWENIKRAERIGSLVLLATAQGGFYLLRIQAFRDISEWQRFCELVKSRVRHCRLAGAGPIRFNPHLRPHAAAVQATNAGAQNESPYQDGPDENSICIHFAPRFLDFLRMNRLAFLRYPIAGIIALITVFFWYPQLDTSPHPAWVLRLAYAVATIMTMPLIFAAPLVALSLRWGLARALREPRAMIFRDSGIQIETRTFAHSLDWAAIKKAKRSGHLVIFTIGQGISGVPREAFADGEWYEFLRLVEAKVPGSRLE